MAKTTASAAVKYYLLAYNLILAILWLQVLVETIKTGNFENVYEKTSPILMIAQTAAVMEIAQQSTNRYFIKKASAFFAQVAYRVSVAVKASPSIKSQ